MKTLLLLSLLVIPLLSETKSSHAMTPLEIETQKALNSYPNNNRPLSPNKNNEKNISNTKYKMEVQLKTILKEVKLYKEKKEKKIVKLETEVDKLKRELSALKNKLKKSNLHQVNSINHKKIIKKEEKVVKRELKKRDTIKERFVKEEKTIELAEINEIEKETIEKELLVNNIDEERIDKQTEIASNKIYLYHKVIKGMKINNNRPFLNIIVKENNNIYDLALKYYGNAHDYEAIYQANKHTIPNDYQLHDGMSLKIPITEAFLENPLNVNIELITAK